MATKPCSDVHSATASGLWNRFCSCIMSIFVLGAKMCVVTLVVVALLWLDYRVPVILRLHDWHLIPVWSMAGWAATLYYGCELQQMIDGEAVCQLLLYMSLPYLSLLRGLMNFSWFLNQATQRVDPFMFTAYSCVCLGILLLHAMYYCPPAQSGALDPLSAINWDQVAAMKAHERVHDVAGYVLEDIYARRRGAEPVMQSRTLAGLAAIYTAAYNSNLASVSAAFTGLGLGQDSREPSPNPSSSSPTIGAIKDDPSALSSSSGHASGSSAAGMPGGQRRAPAGLAALYAAAYFGRGAPDSVACEDLGSNAGESSTHHSVDSFTTASTPSNADVGGIPVGLAPGRTPTLSSKPILPVSPSPPAPASPSPPAPAGTTPTSSPMGSRRGSLLASPARQPSMGLPAAIAAVHIPLTTNKEPPTGQMTAEKRNNLRKRSSSRSATSGKESIALDVSAATMPTTAPRTLIRKSSSIKEKLIEIRAQLGEVTNKLKTKKTRNSPPEPSSPVAKSSSKRSALERHSSWRVAARAVKGGFTLRNTGRDAGWK